MNSTQRGSVMAAWQLLSCQTQLIWNIMKRKERGPLKSTIVWIFRSDSSDSCSVLSIVPVQRFVHTVAVLHHKRWVCLKTETSRKQLWRATQITIAVLKSCKVSILTNWNTPHHMSHEFAHLRFRQSAEICITEEGRHTQKGQLSLETWELYVWILSSQHTLAVPCSPWEHPGVGSSL